MARHLSVLATGIWMVLLALASWILLGVSWAITGDVSLPALTMALMFTGLVIAYPSMVGARRVAAPDHAPSSCRQCGAIPIPGIRFCIRCGAYPKPTPAPH